MNKNIWEQLKTMVNTETLQIMKELEKAEKQKAKKQIQNVEVIKKDLSQEELKINNAGLQRRYQEIKHKITAQDKEEIQRELNNCKELNEIEGNTQRRSYLNSKSKLELIKIYGSNSIKNKSKSDIIEIILNAKSNSDRQIAMIMSIYRSI